jgi:hypothetical protein
MSGSADWSALLSPVNWFGFSWLVAVDAEDPAHEALNCVGFRGDFYRAHKNEGNIAAKHRAWKGNTAGSFACLTCLHT